jgi:hypothetical protein
MTPTLQFSINEQICGFCLNNNNFERNELLQIKLEVRYVIIKKSD